MDKKGRVSRDSLWVNNVERGEEREDDSVEVDKRRAEI